MFQLNQVEIGKRGNISCNLLVPFCSTQELLHVLISNSLFRYFLSTGTVFSLLI